MRSNVALALVATALALTARQAGAQDVRLVARLDAPTRVAVVAIVDDARARRLPTEPLVDKALEGASKRAAPERIVAAVKILASDLARARAALGPDATDAEVVAGAQALHAGASPEALRSLYRERMRGGATVALGVLTELVTRGVKSDTVASTLLALKESGADDTDITDFGHAVARDIALGASPTSAMAVRADGFFGPARTIGGGGPKRKP